MVKKRLVITDLTYMWEDEVCIAGVDKDGNCIRPVTPEGVKRSQIFQGDQLVIYPRALVEFDLSPVSVVMPPHIEDEYFDPNSLDNIVTCNPVQWETILKRCCFSSVEEIYDGYLYESRRVPPDSDTRSLGTITDVRILDVLIDESYGRRQYRIDFEDGAGERYSRYPVNDLAFRSCLEREIRITGSDEEACETLLKNITSKERIYLRIGLARPRQLGDHPMACWTQITGIYTFPDYLEGKTFVDFLDD